MGMTTVFTNGVFDVLHAGHVRLLSWAAAHGDRLVVAINSDASARRLKGPCRPIYSVEERRTVLLAMGCVWRVFVFDDDTPERLIESVDPQVLVKGPAESIDTIPGAAWVLRRGGTVLIPDWDIVGSTSDVERAVLERHGHQEADA